MHRLMSSLTVCFFLCLGTVSSSAGDTPDGWLLAGSHPQDYAVGTVTDISQEGQASAYLASAKPEPGGFGTLMQMFAADNYRGKRLRLAGFIKAEAVAGWAGLWMRVDGPEKSSHLSFDNMQNRPIKGTRDWRRYEIVLDVPQESTNIAFGVLLQGTGKVYLDNLAFEVVPSTVPTTDVTTSHSLAPLNLTFEKK